MPGAREAAGAGGLSREQDAFPNSRFLALGHEEAIELVDTLMIETPQLVHAGSLTTVRAVCGLVEQN